MQAVGSWSVTSCCAVDGNYCGQGEDTCDDKASEEDWLFRLGPGSPQHFVGSTGTGKLYEYQAVGANQWPQWGHYGEELGIGSDGGAPGGGNGFCKNGDTYGAADDLICGGRENWGATDVEVWYPIQ
jgi:hypothetical protein